MLSQEEVVDIAKTYVEIVAKGECAIFTDYKVFEKGVVFNYQTKDFVNTGKNLMFGGYFGFLVDNEKGLIYQNFRQMIIEMNDEQLIKLFQANKIQGISLNGVKTMFNMKKT